MGRSSSLVRRVADRWTTRAARIDSFCHHGPIYADRCHGGHRAAPGLRGWL